MSALRVRCPHCRKKLRIENRKLLGKALACPGCGERVVLRVPSREPEEDTDQELADDIPVGTSPRWVPDPTSPVTQENSPLISDGGVRIPRLDDLSPEETPAFPSNVGGFTPREISGAQRSTRRRVRYSTYVVWGVVGLMACVTLGFVIRQLLQPKRSEPQREHAAVEPNSDPTHRLPYTRQQLEADRDLVDEFSPTRGEPIRLLMVPGGISFLVHLRPADLWSDDRKSQIFRASLTENVTNWISESLQHICHRKPQQIEELLLGFILGAQGSPPEVCVVMRLTEPARMSDLTEEFRGTYLYDVADRPDLRLKVTDTHGYLIHDERTIAICPAHYAAELEHWIQTPNHEVSEGIARLLETTDRERLLTVIGTPGDLLWHLETLIPEPAQPTLRHVLSWIGSDIETMSWSLHTVPYLHSEVMLRPASLSNPLKLQDRLSAQLERLSETILKDVCLKMDPAELRFRRFIGRLPAMLEAFHRSTVIATGANQVRMTTVLPAKAAPNIALALLFTADEAARTDFSAAPSRATASSPQRPETVVERLRLIVDAEFNRTPLEQALQYLCDEVQVHLAVDGDALKDAGYTKNMPQTFNLGNVPMEQALARIIDSYRERNKEMVVSIDESTKTLHVLTRKFAEAKEMPVFKLRSERPGSGGSGND